MRRSCRAMCALLTLPSAPPIRLTSSSVLKSPLSLTSTQHCSTNFASCALCRCLSSSSSLSPMRIAALPPESSELPSSVRSSRLKFSMAFSKSRARDLMLPLCWPSALRTLPLSSFSRASSSSFNALSLDRACSNVRIRGFGSNAWLACP